VQAQKIKKPKLTQMVVVQGFARTTTSFAWFGFFIFCPLRLHP